MINNFNDVDVRNSGLIYNSTFEQIKKLYALDPEQAGELAIAAIELVLTGQISSDDPIIELMLEPTKKINEKNIEKYEHKVETGRGKKIHDQKLDQIADLIQRGYKQREVAERLGLTQQVVSYRWSVIKSNYPELLQKNDTLQENLQETYKNTKEIPNIYKKNEEKVCKDEPIVASVLEEYRF